MIVAFLRLLRLSNVFTAVSNVLCGYFVIYGASYPYNDLDVHPLTMVAIASCLMLLSGMTLNDCFDVKTDMQRYPTRPLPSGKISVPVAYILGFGLMISGVAIASTISGETLAVAILLAIGILAYNAGLKNKKHYGPASLGVCRFCSVLLGMTAAPFPEDRYEGGRTVLSFLYPPEFALEHFFEVYRFAIIVGLYAVLLTYVSKLEEQVNFSQLRRYIQGVFVLLLCPLSVVFSAQGGNIWTALPFLFVNASMIIVALIRVFEIKRSEAIGILVRNMVWGFIFLDAACIAVMGHIEVAAMVSALIVPTFVLSKLIRVQS
ncbi:MAG: UbiA family prenyltransferase [Planctomycetes bacterium]|nr:UbiA family prenyltransferase [Planctomycetota bacterium]